ncbi:hypothetical protein FF1_013839 [Malus domestica]
MQSQRLSTALGPAIAVGEQDLHGLLPIEPAVGFGFVWRLHVLTMLRQAPRAQRPHLVQSVTMDSWSRIQIKKMEADENEQGRWKQQGKWF